MIGIVVKRPRRRKSATWRRVKFTIIRRVLAPLGLLVVKLLMRTWRFRWHGAECLDDFVRGQPPCAVAVFHGSFFCALGGFQSLPRNRKSRIVTMVSPSQDGRLLGEIIASFGMETVSGSPRSRGAAGLLELIEETRAGKVGLLAVDGPRGPRGVPRQGIFTLAAATGARIYAATTHAERAIRFGSWDRAVLPYPFARVDIALERVFDEGVLKYPADSASLLQQRMLESMERLGAQTDGIERIPRSEAG